MKIAYIHYHLKTGGVTTVLKQQIEALVDTCDLLVLSGDLPETPFPCDIVRIPELGYDRPGQKKMVPDDVAASIIEAIKTKWENGCDILHVHNPTLAKNKHFLKILKALHHRKIKLLLQIHDFAEDGRPQAFFCDDQYIADCHYAAINTRDYNLLLKAGLKKEGLHKIANIVKPFEYSSSDKCDSRLVLYPIRAIRRKNIGEAILLSLFFNNDETLAITLPPNSPVDKKSYAGWKTYARARNLKVAFDVGLTQHFTELVRCAGFLITTSITEGFGFSFLEPWTAFKMLWGRKLPDICHDFETNGVVLDHLYTRLNVPLEWIDQQKWFNTWQSCVQSAAAMFNFNIKDITIANAFGEMSAQKTIDFGLLNEAFQKTIIELVLSDPRCRERLICLNPYLAALGHLDNHEALIQNNRHAIMQNYHQPAYRETLTDTYTKVAGVNVRHQIDKFVLISEFMDLNKFSLLKWGPYVEE